MPDTEEKGKKTSIQRPLTIGEFLLEKKPKTEPEILACLAYFLEAQVGKRIELGVAEVKPHLAHTKYKIKDIANAFRNARERNAYFERVSDTRPVLHRLTKTGAEAVEKMPKLSRKRIKE